METTTTREQERLTLLSLMSKKEIEVARVVRRAFTGLSVAEAKSILDYMRLEIDRVGIIARSREVNESEVTSHTPKEVKPLTSKAELPKGIMTVHEEDIDKLPPLLKRYIEYCFGDSALDKPRPATAPDSD